MAKESSLEGVRAKTLIVAEEEAARNWVRKERPVPAVPPNRATVGRGVAAEDIVVVVRIGLV